MGIDMSVRKVSVFLVSLFLLSFISTSVVAHEQKLYTVLIYEQGETAPDNLIDEKFLDGDIVWFKNVDSRTNYTSQAWIDLDGDGVMNSTNDFVSSWMYGDDMCPKDSEGNLTDPDCRESQQFAFNFTDAVGNYSFVIYHAQENDTSNASITHSGSIKVNVDNHTDPGQPSIGDCFGIGCDDENEENTGAEGVAEQGEMSAMQILLIVVLILSVVSSFGLMMSIINERQESEKDYSLQEE